MDQENITVQYNYDAFITEKFSQWMNFEASPVIGEPAPDFPLWYLDESETRLSEIWSQYSFTLVEFGSFT